MDDRTLLSELAHEVKEAEREELLKKLKGRQAPSSSAGIPFREIKDSHEEEKKIEYNEKRIRTLRQKYEKLSLLQKFLVFCKQLFKRIDFNKAVEMTLLENLGNSLSSPPTPMISSDGFTLTNIFADQIALLHESLNQMKTFLKSVEGENEPGDFYFFAFEEI